MKIICEKGFYKFFPQNIGEIARFKTKTGYILTECGDYFTFETLANLPNYSFTAQLYSGIIPGLKNYAGLREEVMAENGYAFYLKTQTLILKSLIFQKADYFQSNFIFSNSLPQAYSYDSSGVITGFHGFVDVDFMKFKIEKFFYESIL